MSVTEAELIAALEEQDQARAAAPRKPKAAAPAPVPKAASRAAAEEEVAAELEKLMGPPPSNTAQPSAPEREYGASVTEAELIAAMDNIAKKRLRTASRPAASATNQRQLSPAGVAAMIDEMTTGSDAA